MPAPVTINLTQAAVGAPLEYTIPDSMELEPLSIFARFDGSAAGTFRPSVSVYSGAGLLIGRFFPSEPVAAGDSADVTFAPFLGRGGGQTLLAPEWAAFYTLVALADGAVTDVGPGATGAAVGDMWAKDVPGGWWTTDQPGIYLIYQHVLWGLPGPPAVPVGEPYYQTWRADPDTDPGIREATTFPYVKNSPDGSVDPTGLAQSNLEAVLVLDSNMAGPVGIVAELRQDSGVDGFAFVQQTIVRVTQNDNR